MSISEKDQKILWGKAAGRCSMPNCRKEVVLEASDKLRSKNVLIGQNCHIVGEGDSSPRGNSILTHEERDSYTNLILLCANHHVMIDQDLLNWPVEKLHQVKAEHEIWVETRLTETADGIGRQVYSDLVNNATERILIDSWDWFSDNAVRFLLSEKFVDGVNTFWNKVQRTAWPGELPELEDAIRNLSERAGKYVEHFLTNASLSRGSSKPGEGFYVEDKSWKAHWQPNYDDFAEKSRGWQKQSIELLFNLTVALNDYAASVRKSLNPRYFAFEGKFVVTDSLGVLSELRPAIYTPGGYSDRNEQK